MSPIHLAFTGILALAPTLQYIFAPCIKDTSSPNDENKKAVQARVDELAKRMGITRSIKVIENEQIQEFCFFKGVMCLSGPVIGINPSTFYGRNESQKEADLAHALAHIKNHDQLYLGLSSGLVGFATVCFALSSRVPVIAAYALAVFSSFAIWVILHRKREWAAFKNYSTACSFKTQEFLLNKFPVSIDNRCLCQKIRYSVDGEDRFCLETYKNPSKQSCRDFLRNLLCKTDKSSNHL